MKYVLSLALVVLGPSLPGVAAAQQENGLFDRPELLDGPRSPKQHLRERGIDVHGSLTQFYQGVVGGDGDREWQYGGKGDLIATFDGAKLGLWRGVSVNVHQEWLYGEDVNNQGDGSLIPLNTALAFPRLGGHEQDTSISVTQRFGERLSVGAGKFNMLDAASKTPLLGGGGLNTFMNLGVAAPLSGVTPPYIVGANATLKTDPAIFSLLVYDPRNAENWDVVSDPFAEGTTTSLSITFPTQVAGRTGFYGVRGVYSTQDGLDLANIPQLIGLPPQSTEVLKKDGFWYFSASVQQYLWQSSANPAVGWGLFAEGAISDGNPNPIGWHVLVGFGGNSPLPGRELDRWGVAYFKYALSNDLLTGLNDIGFHFTDEQGVEIFYNLAVTPWFLLTADLQWIDTHRSARDDALVAAVRAQTKF